MGSQLSAIPSWSTLADYPAGDYVISVYDRSWQDSCFTNITLNEPDPIVIHTTVDSASAAWVNDGSILIDSITGGVNWAHANGTTSFYTGGLTERFRITNEGRVQQLNTSIANSCFDILNTIKSIPKCGQ